MPVQEKKEILLNYVKMWLKAVKSKGADVEYINLYDYDFKGCMSCFTCHLKKKY